MKLPLAERGVKRHCAFCPVNALHFDQIVPPWPEASSAHESVQSIALKTFIAKVVTVNPGRV